MLWLHEIMAHLNMGREIYKVVKYHPTQSIYTLYSSPRVAKHSVGLELQDLVAKKFEYLDGLIGLREGLLRRRNSQCSVIAGW